MDVTLNDLAKMRRAVYLLFAMRIVFCKCNFLSCLILAFSLAAAYTSAGASAVYFTASRLLRVVILPEQTQSRSRARSFTLTRSCITIRRARQFQLQREYQLVGVSCSPEN